jgi:hypothetical protein
MSGSFRGYLPTKVGNDAAAPSGFSTSRAKAERAAGISEAEARIRAAQAARAETNRVHAGDQSRRGRVIREAGTSRHTRQRLG